MDSSQIPSEKAPSGGLITRALRFLWGILRSYFIIVGAVVTILPLLFVYFIAHSMQSHGPHQAKGKGGLGKDKTVVLTLNLDGGLAERAPHMSSVILEKLFGKPEGIYLPDLQRSLRIAAHDDRIKGLHLDLTHLEGGSAELAELRTILQDFRESDKPVHIFTANLDDKTLFVASGADHISIPPTAEIMLPGPMFELVYFAEALKKLGVQMEVTRHGRFKSAFEPFVLNAPSPESLEMYKALESSLRGSLVEAVAEGREKTKEAVQGWLALSVFTAPQALQAGMVDQLSYFEESRNLLKTSTEAKDFLSFEDFEDSAVAEATTESDSANSEDGIALIEAVGEIHLAPSGRGGSDDNIVPEEINKELEWAKNEKNVKAVVLRVSSPGGSAVASDLIWREVKRLREVKPVVVSMGNYAASGGYYIASAANRIIADPSTITGSIGVIGMTPKLTGVSEKYGVHFHLISESNRRAFLDPGSSSTDEDKRLIGASIDAFYQTFLERVAEGRNMTPANVDAVAQGRVWTGEQALDIKLVDELGGLKDAFQAAKELGGLDPSLLYPVYRRPSEEFSLSECLKSPHRMLECLSDVGATVSAVQARSLRTKGGNLLSRYQDLALWLSETVESFAQEPVQAIWPKLVLRGTR